MVDLDRLEDSDPAAKEALDQVETLVPMDKAALEDPTEDLEAITDPVDLEVVTVASDLEVLEDLTVDLEAVTDPVDLEDLTEDL